MFLFAILSATVVIGVVVLATPKPADDPAFVAEQQRLLLDRPEPLARPEFPPASLVLPTAPTKTSDEELYESLKQIADEAVRQLPREPAALHMSAMIYAELKQTETAQDLWKRCLELKPMQPGPYVGYADLLLNLGQAEQAAALLEDHWSQLASWPPAVLMRARVLDQLGEPEQAATLLESSLRVHPEVAESWFQLGQVQNELRQYIEAESSFRTAVGLGVTNDSLIFALSNSLAGQKRTEEAKQLREKFQELRKSNADPSGNRFQEAYSVALHAIAARAMLNAAAMYGELGDTARAERLTLQLLALDPDHVTAHMTLSSILRRTGRLPDALLVQERILELEPDNPLNVINLASVLFELGRLDKAEAVLKAAADQSSARDGLMHAELARVYLTLERYEDARMFAREAIKREPAKGYYAILASACKELDDKGGMFEALSGIQRLEREGSTAALATLPGAPSGASQSEMPRASSGAPSSAEPGNDR